MSNKKREYTPEEIRALEALGDRIRILRENKGLSQHFLSIESELPKNQIGRIERAEINTTFISLYKIAKALEVSITTLLEH